MHFLSIDCEILLSVYGMQLYHFSSNIRNLSHITYYSLMSFIAFTFKGQVHVFAGQVKIVSHSFYRTSAILKYFCPLLIKCIKNDLLLFQVDNFINETRLKIYSLLSGQLVLSSPANLVNTCEGLDWKRSLALHLW